MIRIKDGMQRCMRCSGHKKMYKVGGGYSLRDTGGVLQDCPMCLGVGAVKTLEALKDLYKTESQKQELKQTDVVEFISKEDAEEKKVLKLNTKKGLRGSNAKKESRTGKA